LSNIIIDRRSNPHGKSLSNRQRFIKRTKEQIKDSIDKTLGDRSVGGSSDGHDVNISRKSIKEPQFGHDPATGEKDTVLPGNKEYMPGDQIQKPKKGKGGGRGNEPSDTGEGEDDFIFNLNNDEFVDILFEDLELPNLAKKENKVIESYTMSRSGFTNEGSPTQLNLEKSMVSSLGRRIALLKPKRRRIREIEELLAVLDAKDELTDEEKQTYVELTEEATSLRVRARAISFIDPIDLRYNNFFKTPNPTSQAVVFFVMDVSASMSEYHKDVAKRFFTLLNLFISRKYRKIEPVFVRYHTESIECDEHDFFHARETGGTVTSCAFETVIDIIKDRYPVNDWNIYISHASDGDNFYSDNVKLLKMLDEELFPIIQHYSYIQVKSEHEFKTTGNLYDVFNSKLNGNVDNFIAKEIKRTKDIYPIFREIFKKENNE